MTTTTKALRRQLVQLDTQIVEQKRILGGLEQIRSDVERELHDTATFPVMTLPAEIIAEICFHCLPDNDWWYPFHSVTGVCRAWRDIAFATPRLWSTLDVPRLPSQPGLLESYIDRWLARAGTLPLSLIFKVPIDSLFGLDRLRDVIQRSSHRVQYLELDIGCQDFRELGLDLAEFPLLERAVLECGSELDPIVTFPAPVFCNAPRLHDVRLWLPYQAFEHRRLVLPWLQLTKFDGNVSTLDLFTLAPNLVEVKCSFDCENHLASVAKTHPRLNSLTLTNGSLDIIQYLTLPALKHLDIDELADEDYHSLEPFLMRSSPPLVSLSVRADGDCYQDWCRCLPRVASTLENLQISSASSKVMIDLCVGHWNSWSLYDLPNVRAISFQRTEGNINLSWMIDFLYSRSDKLRSFRLVWSNNPFLDGTYVAGPEDTRTMDTISGHLSRISRAGLAVYVGTNDKNYAASIDSAIGV